MNCRDFETLLDGLEPGTPLSAEARAHADGCPSCAFALRLEAELREAPRWAESPRLAPERRAGLMARARLAVEGTGFSGAGPLLEQSALTALVTFALLVALGYGVPVVLRGVLSPALYETVAREVEPAVQTLRALVDPILQHGWGMTVLAAAGLSLCFAAAVSAQLFLESRRV